MLVTLQASHEAASMTVSLDFTQDIVSLQPAVAQVRLARLLYTCFVQSQAMSSRHHLLSLFL